MAERRKYPRIDKTLRVILRWPIPPKPGEPTKTASTVGMTANVSAEGMLLFAKNPPIVGTPVHITTAWDRPPAAFEHRGRIIRSNTTPDGRFELGIKFIPTDDRQEARWQAFCSEILSNQPESARVHSFDLSDDAPTA